MSFGSFELNTITLAAGTQPERAHRLSLLEAVAWAAGEAHSDQPQCVCPVIAAFSRMWSDRLADDDDRGLLLKPLIPALINTRATQEVEEKRGWLAVDWLIRIHLSAWLQLSPKLHPYAKILFEFPEVRDSARAASALHCINAAKMAAQYLAGASSWIADPSLKVGSHGLGKWEGSRSSSWSIAGAISREAVDAAAGSGARCAGEYVAPEVALHAWKGAREAAWAAASRPALMAASRPSSLVSLKSGRGAAQAAAKKALKPTLIKLQQSAVDLLHHMLGCQ